jgi:hypothetical protein
VAGFFVRGTIRAMNNQRRTKHRIALRSALAGLFAVTICSAFAYLGAYLLTGCRSIEPTIEGQIYNHEWQADFFRPASRLESFVRGTKVDTGYKSN